MIYTGLTPLQGLPHHHPLHIPKLHRRRIYTIEFRNQRKVCRKDLNAILLVEGVNSHLDKGCIFAETTWFSENKSKIRFFNGAVGRDAVREIWTVFLWKLPRLSIDSSIEIMTNTIAYLYLFAPKLLLIRLN